MRIWGTVAASTIFVACSSHHDSAEPSACSPEQRNGTYLIKFATVSGNCGNIPDGVASLASASAMAPGCKLLQEDRITENGCKLERALECVSQVDDALAWGGKSELTLRTVAVTRQMTADGSRIEGIETMTASGTSDGPCTGTYNISATRQ